MAKPTGFPPSNSDWPTQEPPLKSANLQQISQQQSQKFQALSDWNRFWSAPTSSWGPNAMSPVSIYGDAGYVQHHCSGRLHSTSEKQKDLKCLLCLLQR